LLLGFVPSQGQESVTAAADPGPATFGQLDALLKWVEEGKAPDTLEPLAATSPAKWSGRVLVPIPAGGPLQSKRQHGRRGELRVQHELFKEPGFL
jgi:hypothetical protein